MTVDTKPVIEAHTLLEMAGRNFGVVQRQVKDLTHEDSLLQLPFRGNCLNWVMGHIMQSRDKMLQQVDEPSVWTADQIARYERESPPVTSVVDAIRFEQILTDFQTTHERLTSKLKMMSIDDLTAPAKEVIKGIPDWNVAEFLHFLLWHETYHVGQTELLRQLAGKNDKVI
jgi:hypothetical protein